MNTVTALPDKSEQLFNTCLAAIIEFACRARLKAAGKNYENMGPKHGRISVVKRTIDKNLVGGKRGWQAGLLFFARFAVPPLFDVRRRASLCRLCRHITATYGAAIMAASASGWLQHIATSRRAPASVLRLRSTTLARHALNVCWLCSLGKGFVTKAMRSVPKKVGFGIALSSVPPMPSTRPSLIQETPHLPAPARMLQLPQRLRLDLPDPLAGDGKLLPDLLERVIGVHPDAEAHPQHPLLARRQ